ncbi:methylenetetrahydrofolate reductase [NAD(P)H] [Desulfonatronovibrio hydrogenovorans]|uniref:methylenetetrahydrofolate reductase [NAD(P)H] n=1 Tax=Desulfonatronovibrio hydrogenovorans TaxID=53245 RepID=UPI00048ADF30|nr:methylenetetrahydrofolate reductase [NAD(P)H] [Desulfonatronovibrio hydrogenovorans]
MKISQLISGRSPFFSLEFFPPKDKSAWPAFFDQVEKLKEVDPAFVSVTYGAGGSTQANTLEIVDKMKNELGLEPMAHLTCVGASRDRITNFMSQIRQAGVQNVLALRGDPPKGEDSFVPDSEEFQHASDLVSFISREFPDVCMGVAAYPEGHVEAVSLDEDVFFLKKKLDQGGEFAVTQLFFDNKVYFDFIKRVRSAGVDKPIIPGILPVTAIGIIKKSISLSGASLPDGFMESLEKAEKRGGPEEVKRVGTEHAINQVRGLIKGGAPGVHLYTLNKAETCLEIIKSLG